jgi:hypothetical protein
MPVVATAAGGKVIKAIANITSPATAVRIFIA